MANQRGVLQDPLIQTSSERRWTFIRKVYSILILQLLTTIFFAAIVTSVHPIATFFTTPFGLAVYVIIFIAPFIVIGLIHLYLDKHPLDLVLLGIFILCFGLALGVVSAFVDNGKIIIEAALATTAVVVSLTLYTFWTARTDNFSFQGPIWLSLLVIILMFANFQIFFPIGKISDVICSGVAVLFFSAYVIYYTLSETKSYKYIWASVSLYLIVFKFIWNLVKKLC